MVLEVLKLLLLLVLVLCLISLGGGGRWFGGCVVVGECLVVTALFLLAFEEFFFEHATPVHVVVPAAGWACFHRAGARSWAWDQIAIFARLIPRGSAAPFRIVCLVIEPGLLMGTACAGGYLGFHAAFEDQLLDFRLEVAS